MEKIYKHIKIPDDMSMADAEDELEKVELIMQVHGYTNYWKAYKQRLEEFVVIDKILLGREE